MRCRTCSLLVVLTFLFLQVTLAAETKPVAPAPIPTQIASAKRIFVANAGENQPFYEGSPFTGGSERAYDEFYAGVKALGRYELVGSPGEADLLMEIELTAPEAGPMLSMMPSIPYDVQFRLAIRDPKTNALLWVVNEHVQWAILQGNHDKNFEQAMDRLINDVQGLASRAAAPANMK